jgi:Family of unknown function (DUF5677)
MMEAMPTIRASWPEVLALAKQLLQDVTGARPQREIEVRTPDDVILGKFWRSVRLFDAILLLLEAQLPEESAILGRSLFKESLQLLQLADEASSRAALALAWANDSISEKIRLIQSAVRFGDEADPAPTLAQLEQQRRDLLTLSQRNGIGRLPKFLSVEAAARRFGRLDDLWTYEWSHESVHGSDSAWLFARHKLPSGVVGLFAKTSDPQVLIGFACFAARSLRDAAQSAAAIFSWQMPSTVATLTERMQAAANTYAD